MFNQSTGETNIFNFVYKWENWDKHYNSEKNRSQASYSPVIYTVTHNALQYKIHVNITDIASSVELFTLAVHVCILKYSFISQVSGNTAACFFKLNMSKY